MDKLVIAADLSDRLRNLTGPSFLADTAGKTVAVVVSAVEPAADRPHRPVLVDAVGTQVLERISWDQDTLSHEPQTLGPARHLWSRTDLLAPQDRAAAVEQQHAVIFIDQQDGAVRQLGDVGWPLEARILADQLEIEIVLDDHRVSRP